eukprot:2455816-Ditylum_brightwellii.AAC.1
MSNNLDYFDIDKSKCKEDDNVVIEEVAGDNSSVDSKENEGRHIDKFGNKETLQAGDTIKYTKSN